MNKRTRRLLGEIEAGALNQKVPIGDLLRNVIALGGKAGSAEMRDWATRELRGYGPDDELPPYRTVSAPIKIDGNNMGYVLKGQAISTWDLPEFARDKITEQVALRHSVDDLDRLARDPQPGGVVRMGPLMAQELVTYMNRTNYVHGQIDRLYWAVSQVTIGGVIDQVRTTLTVMVSEIRATMPGDAVITPEVATNAVHVAIEGKRNKVKINATQGQPPVPTEESPRRWVRTAAAVILGLVAIVGVFFTLMQTQGWEF